MGNVVSKKKSTRDVLKNLDKMIIKFENNKKSIVKSQSTANCLTFYVFFILLTLSLIYAFCDEQSLVLFAIFPIISVCLLKFALSVFYNWRLENILLKLEDLREQQKEYIKILKEEDDYKATMELLEKYEGSTLRNTSFSRLSQKKPNVIEKVADIVLGDDPTKMYALICAHCHYHNGMVHPEDRMTEYICYNCGTKNKRTFSSNKEL
ncbi:hypothetical protein NCER_101576 [Vairimorpha ceranae BRL01]|uniref:Endoplasmic reticulum junction formation protein lunapark n=2 Tax=Vairimorpha ceranae TaxID=40302 RepID=C4VAC0_VAIC1|nr:integral membrane metal-binding protein [Vairimorpha ceranae]EEQ81836.1 hypothetical protein NCER_101576 [Vairimorpha ceranae BRL01]KAF5140542.1 hypothetical protein G9O61_00g013470 [Vairimorpha ceranae]KKO75228.1 integral membrane metal-binding protein [Vairimorpha ceranae]